MSLLETHQRGVAVIGTGMAIPGQKVTNHDLSERVDTSDEWIVQRTGIRSRYLLSEGEKIEDLAADAVTQALEKAGKLPTDLDLLICATTRPDMLCPALGCRIVEKVGAIPCGAFDLNVACSGFMAAMNLAWSHIRSGACQRIAVVGAECLSRYINWEDRRTCVLFGDAASCAILEATDDPEKGCLYQSLHSNAKQGEALYLPESESDIPEAQLDSYNQKLNTLQMNGRSVYRFAVNVLTESMQDAMRHTGLEEADIAMVLPHQSNIRMINSASSVLGFSESKISINIDKYGNTGAASCGICLHEALASGKLSDGEVAVFVAQGGGLSWGASVWRV